MNRSICHRSAIMIGCAPRVAALDKSSMYQDCKDTNVQRALNRPNRKPHRPPVALTPPCTKANHSPPIFESRLLTVQRTIIFYGRHPPQTENLNSSTAVSKLSEFPSCSNPISLYSVSCEFLLTAGCSLFTSDPIDETHDTWKNFYSQSFD